MSYDIRNIHNINHLIMYFSKVLNWDIDTDSFDDIDDISYDFSASDLGLKEEAFAKIKSIKQLPPMVDGQKWGIFCIEFDSKRFEVTALRKVLSGLVPSRRNSADHAVWSKEDLLFLCFWGEDNNRTIGIAHFEDKQDGLPQIKMTYCAPAIEDTIHIQDFVLKIGNLTWPIEVYNYQKWHDDWSKAFTTSYKQVIRDSQTLTIQLAKEAIGIRDRILETLKIETEAGYVHQLYNKFKETLIHDMSEKDFADMYAQTVVYGLFSARCMDETQENFSASEAVDCIPNTNPFLKNLMKECLGAQEDSKLSFDELEIGNVVELLEHTKTDDIIHDFNRQTGGGKEDPVIHFYEEFLNEYDKTQKVQRGVYYTPQPVVNFIVHSVDSIIKDRFDLEDGLASTSTKRIKYLRQSKKLTDGYFYKKVEDSMEVPAVQILDPATGTGTFIRQTILQIYNNFRLKNQDKDAKTIHNLWNEYVPKHLLPRLNAFELMMAPYAVAHMKIAMILKDTGYEFSSNNRLNIYLTNSLEEPGNSDKQVSFWDDPLASESIAANEVKKNEGINVIIGNPPYAGESSNKGEWILSLMEDYKYEPGSRIKLQEANSKFVNDDYVKFIRYSQFVLDASNNGILCFICPHGYIDNPTFRGVRYSLLKSFSEIYILDLHGNSKKKEKAPDGSKDENVFDIQQGVCISLFIKRKNNQPLGKVYHADLYGDREYKYKYLTNTAFSEVNWREVPLVEPNYFFNYMKSDIEDEYNKGFSVRDLFPLGTLGVLSKRDSLVVGFSKDELEEKIASFINPALSTSEACSIFNIPVRDNDKWDADNVRKMLSKRDDLDSEIIEVHYRPFDTRYLLYDKDLVARQNIKVLQHINGHDNLALVLCRQGGAANLDNWDSIFVVDMISDQNIYRRGGGTVLPLYLYEEELGKQKQIPNLNPDIYNQIVNKLATDGNTEKSAVIAPIEIVGYIYAILHSLSYRNKYQEYLNKDFPRVPYPENMNKFKELVRLGLELVETHTKYMQNEDFRRYNSSGYGDNVATKTMWNENRLYINKNQYLENVAKEVYDYTIGGNSPIQKWLKDRKGLMLSEDDIITLQKIIAAISDTIDIVKRIDCVIA